MSEEKKKVWVCKKATDEQLENVLNELADAGYQVFKLELGVATVTRQHEDGLAAQKETVYLIVAFNAVELAKKMASAQVLQAIQQAGADALNAAIAKEKEKKD